MLEGDLRDVDALHVGRVAVDVPRAVRMDVDPLAPFDDLQPVVARRRFGDETRVLAFDGIDTHGDPGVGEQLSVLQEAEGQSILADEQLGRREQDLKAVCSRRGELGRRPVTLGEADGEESQRDRAGDEGRTPARPSLPFAIPQ